MDYPGFALNMLAERYRDFRCGDLPIDAVVEFA